MFSFSQHYNKHFYTTYLLIIFCAVVTVNKVIEKMSNDWALKKLKKTFIPQIQDI